VLPIIREIQRAGAKTLRAVAEALNARGVPTARGGRWQAMTVLKRPCPHLISLGNGNGWPQSTFTLQTDGTGDQTGSSPQRPLG